MNEKTHSLKVAYRRASDYHILPIAGGIAGVTPQNMVICHVYLETPDLPEYSELVFNSDSTLKEELIPDVKVSREILVGLLLRPSDAIELGNLLLTAGNTLSDKPETKSNAGPENATS